MKVEIYEDTPGQWRWRIRAVNGRIMAISGESYANKANALRAIDTLVHAIRDGRVELER